jgi:hypothetical protein
LKHNKYLEIYPSEVAARKISKHLDTMAANKPRVYRKTLLRYKQLAGVLLECVAKIVRMLQSEMLLSSGDSEFQELLSDFDTEKIDELRDSVDMLGNLVDKTSSAENRKLSGDTVRIYKSVYGSASEMDFGYVEVNECANLLKYWIDHRFSGRNPNFKFQIKQLPIWATFIVIAYGKYRSIGYSTKFVKEFKAWCDSLADDKTNCWALPYTVFNMTKVIDDNNFTLDAVIIYDLLIDGCLYQLTDIKVPMDSFYIAKLVKDRRPELAHDVRTRFTRQKELIELLNLRATNVTAEEDKA